MSVIDCNTTVPETVYVSHNDTNKLIRAALAQHFPGVKFSVTASKYSGGGSTTVAWTDGPTTNAVDRVIGRFEGRSFDGMTDSSSTIYHTTEGGAADGQRVNYGANYLHTRRSYSSGFLARCLALEAAHFGQPHGLLLATYQDGTAYLADAHASDDPMVVQNCCPEWMGTLSRQVLDCAARNDARADLHTAFCLDARRYDATAAPSCETEHPGCLDVCATIRARVAALPQGGTK